MIVPIGFIEDLETVVRDKILEKNELWFKDPPSLEDIEYNWNGKILQQKTILFKNLHWK